MYSLYVTERKNAPSVAVIVDSDEEMPIAYQWIYGSESFDAMKRRAISWLYSSVCRNGQYGQLRECKLFKPTDFNAVWAAFV